MADLFSCWSNLTEPTDSKQWTASKVSGRGRVARTIDGGAALLFSIDEEMPPSLHRLRTSHVEYTRCRELSIRTDGVAEHGRYAVLHCTGLDTELVRHFLRVAATLPDNATSGELEEAILQLFELFRSLGHRGTHTVQGIWAETFVAAYAADPGLLVAAWHSDPDDLHDFVGNGYQLEVKSSARDLREHEFSLEQLERSPSTTIVVSLLLDVDDIGASVFDLLRSLTSRLPLGLARRAEVIVSKALGDLWREADEIRFSVPSALSNLQIFGAEAIPRPPGPMPETVSQVKFRSDLSALTPGVTAGGALVAALPKPSKTANAT